MICDNCIALRSEGYEYPEYYCGAGVSDEKTYEFKNGTGCRLRLTTIKKRLDENDNAYAEDCQKMAEWYVLKNDIEKIPDVLEKCIDYAKHAIGMDRRKTYKRHGKVFYRPYRNFFSTSEWSDTYKPWRTMELAGLAEEVRQEHNPDLRMYHLTEKGVKWLGEKIGVTIRPEEK